MSEQLCTRCTKKPWCVQLALIPIHKDHIGGSSFLCAACLADLAEFLSELNGMTVAFVCERCHSEEEALINVTIADMVSHVCSKCASEIISDIEEHCTPACDPEDSPSSGLLICNRCHEERESVIPVSIAGKIERMCEQCYQELAINFYPYIHKVSEDSVESKKPVVTVSSNNGEKFAKECSDLIEKGYSMVSSNCGFVNSDKYDFCESYQAVLIL